MLSALRARLTYANVMATIAVFIALGGTGYAAVQLSKNSVRSKHIRNGQVKAADVGRNAVTSAKVRDRALLSQDFAPGQLPQGAQGPRGERGLQGPAGEDFSAASTLKPGEVLSGPYIVMKDGGTGSGASLSTAIQFSPPLAADLCTNNTCAEYTTSSTATCPGPGQSSPVGRLCFYATDDSANLTYNGTSDPRSTGFGVRRYGTILSFSTPDAQQGFSQGTWTLTAP